MKFQPDLPIEDDPPEAPLRGNLVLTGTQERKLARHFLARLAAAARSYTSDKWAEKRDTAMKHYAGVLTDRERPGTIFEKSNMTLNLPKRYVRITASRVYDELLTASPMISVTAEGKEDDWEDARVLERYCSYKLEEAKMRRVLREAETLAGIRGETVVKTTWKRTVQRYWKTADVLVGPGGQTLRSRDGNPICRTDSFDEQEDGRQFLSRDPAIVLPEAPVWDRRREQFNRTTFCGLEAATLNHRDFICSTTEECIHKTDFTAVLVDLSLDEVQGMLAPYRDDPRVEEYLSRLETSLLDGEGKTHAGEADEDRGEASNHEEAIPKCPYAEVYARVIVSEDGHSDEIAALLDLENEVLMTYEYLDNISPTGRRPLRVVRMEPVPHRWYGTGFYELFADRHKFCDTFLNRVNLAASLSGNIKIENPHATEEGMAGEPIEFGTPKTYRLRDGFEMKDVFSVIPIPNDSGPSENLLNMMMQVTQLEAGVVSAGDHGLAGLPAAGLATGIKSLDRVANVLLKNILFDYVESFEDILNDSVALILSFYDEHEARMLMGEKAARVLARYRDITQLPMRTKLQLSASKDADVIANHTRAYDMLVQFEQMPPEARERIRPVLMKILTVMGIEEVDKALDARQAAPSLDPADAPDEEATAALAEAAQPPTERGHVTDATTPNVETTTS